MAMAPSTKQRRKKQKFRDRDASDSRIRNWLFSQDGLSSTKSLGCDLIFSQASIEMSGVSHRTDMEPLYP